jgi:hypothetical protein
MSRLLSLLSSVIAIGIGIVTLIGLLAGVGFLAGPTNLFLQLTVITVAITLLIGIINLLGVHLRRIISRKGGWVYSIPLVLSAVLVIGLWLSGSDETNMALLEGVQVSIESALAGLLLFALVYGAYRLMHRRVTWTATLFTLVLIIILIGALPLAQVGALAQIRAWLLAVPVSAGARGILLGITLATIVTGIRVLIGQERSYRD